MMRRRPLSPAEREAQSLPIVGERRQSRPADLADIACAIGCVLIALTLAVAF